MNLVTFVSRGKYYITRRYQSISLPRCLACNTKIFREVYVQKPYWVLQCKNCGLGITLPLAYSTEHSEKHSQIYSKKDYIEIYQKYYAPYLLNSFSRGLTRIAASKPSGSVLLDVGSGFGYFLNMARQHEYIVEGIEVAPQLALEGRQRYGLNIQSGNFLDVNLGGKTYDVITLWDVLEHLPNPLEVLKKISKAMKPDGILLIRVPDFSYFQRDLPRDFTRAYTRHIYPMDVQEHAYHYSQESLSMLLKMLGLEIIGNWNSKEDEYTPKDIPGYTQLINQMNDLDVSCEMNVLARLK